MIDLENNQEWRYISSFILGTEYWYELALNQLRCLWTAFCFHEDLNVDTHDYDLYMGIMYKTMEANPSAWYDGYVDVDADSAYESFYNYMCEYLV